MSIITFIKKLYQIFITINIGSVEMDTWIVGMHPFISYSNSYNGTYKGKALRMIKGVI